MVGAGDVILVGGIILGLFFSKDIINFLNSLKGFTATDLIPSVNINIPPLPPLPPEITAIPTEVSKIFTDPAKSVLSPVFVAGQETAKIFTDPATSVLSPVFEAGVETRVGVDKAIFDFQQSSENFAEQIKTQIGGIELGFQQTQTNIDKFFTSISEGFVSPFGGQTEPKMVLTKDTATEPPQEPTPILQKKAGVFEPAVKEIITDPIIQAEQPDLSLVSPFLTGGGVIEVEEEQTRGELRFGR